MNNRFPVCRKGAATAAAPAAKPTTKPAILNNVKFDKVEKELTDLVSNPANADKLKAEWKNIDYNGNNIVSLAEIDKYVVSRE